MNILLLLPTFNQYNLFIILFIIFLLFIFYYLFLNLILQFYHKSIKTLKPQKGINEWLL